MRRRGGRHSPDGWGFVRSILLLAQLVLPARAGTPYRVLAFGDSHTAVEAGMTSALSKALDYPVEYARVGVKGAHTKDLLRGFTQGRPPYAQSIAWAEEWRPNLVLIAFGTNDAVDQVGAQYELNFADLLTQLQRAFPSAQIVALGPPAGDPAKMPSLNLVRAMQAEAAGEVHVAWIDRAAIAFCQLQADGVHLTANSYRALAEQVAPRLVAVLGK